MRMNRTTNPIRSGLLLLLGACVVGGCAQPTPSVRAPATPATNVPPQVAAPAQPTSPQESGAQPQTSTPQTAVAAQPNFQPYTVLPALPPKPKHVTHQRARLHLTQKANRYYLVDDDRHRYEAARDNEGNLYPVYHDPDTQQTIPLYYDQDRDRYYRVGRDSETHHYYRGYLDDPGDRYYEDDKARPDDEYYRPAAYHRPEVITPPHHSRNRDAAWLLAIPVVVGAYFLLKPHQHNAQRPVYGGAPQAIVRPYPVGSDRPSFGTRPGSGRPPGVAPAFGRPPSNNPIVAVPEPPDSASRPFGSFGTHGPSAAVGSNNGGAGHRQHGSFQPASTRPAITPAAIRPHPGASSASAFNRPPSNLSPSHSATIVPRPAVSAVHHGSFAPGLRTRPGPAAPRPIAHAAAPVTTRPARPGVIVHRTPAQTPVAHVMPRPVPPQPIEPRTPAPRPIAHIMPRPVGQTPAPRPVAHVAPRPVGQTPPAPRPIAHIMPRPVTPRPIEQGSPAPKPVAHVAPPARPAPAPAPGKAAHWSSGPARVDRGNGPRDRHNRVPPGKDKKKDAAGGQEQK